MPMVGIVMGSDSDLKVMSSAAVMLEELGIEYEMRIISAHREPDLLIEWTRTAKDRGIKVMIAGAGMAAALPGMLTAPSSDRRLLSNTTPPATLAPPPAGLP